MLEGKVAIVTGAGRGLGRAEALQLAKMGARVVVNDLGVELDGSGGSQSPAQQVVDEIAAAGGEAIAHPGDVANWDDAQGLINKALETFGGLDILVNNAGFLRDRMVFNMSEEEWDAVIRVHLKGHFCTTKWATVHWRELSKEKGGPVYGRIINTASEAFLFGAPGQPNYAAAKAGIAALTMATAQACQRYGVTANAICPRARTRMTEGVAGGMFEKPEEGFDAFAPENVVPLVGYLASPAAEKVSGQVFIIYGNRASVLTSPQIAKSFDTEGTWTVEGLVDAMGPYFEKREPITDGFAMLRQ
ncbi:MAG: 3-oxoacyl-ACP reductase [Chloroflexi bacterium]|nr:3-oxoacyl-ACP reductase [Chloroflexota bacterium]